MKKIIFMGLTALIAIHLSSCKGNKYLVKNNVIYRHEFTTGPAARSSIIHKYKVNKKTAVEIADNDKYVVIKTNASLVANITEITTAGYPIRMTLEPSWRDDLTTEYYYSESKDPSQRNYLKYLDGKTVFQAASIPIKIRSSVGKKADGNYLASTTETGFTVGFLGGYRFALNKFNGKKNFASLTTQRLSITPGVFLATGAADLSATSTSPAITYSRKAPMLTFGGTVVFGFNNINLGYAFGFDNAMGSSASSWRYQGKLWNGIILSLDLIK